MDAFKLAGKTAVVTGAGRGIGKEIALVLARAGANIVVAEYDAKSGQESADELRALGVKSSFISVDVRNSESVKVMTEAAVKQFDAIDILVNNAGIADNIKAEDYPDDAWLNVLDVNLNGVFWCCREIGKRMLERGKGAIVNIASMSGVVVNDPQPQAAYNVSKAGVIMLTKSLAAEWAKRGVRVNSVSPGYIMTDLVRDVLGENEVWKNRWLAMTPQGRLGEPADVAHAVLYLASDASKYATGTNLVVDGGYTSW